MPSPRSTRIGATLAGALGAQAVLYLALLGRPGEGNRVVLLATTLALWVAAVAALARLRLTARGAALVVLGAAAALQVAAMAHPPFSSDDDYRYVWDAKVQLAGVDPYRFPPSAPQLARLREPFLFNPAPVGAASRCPPGFPHRFPGGCTAINRPTVRTIYPPVAEAAFVAVRIASFGGHGGHLPLQIAGALGSLVIAVLLLRRGPPWRAAVWAWCPVTVLEYANNAHIDWLAVLLVVLAFVARFRASLVGVLVGAAVAVKLYPALVLPALMRRNWLVAVPAVGFVALVYLPHVLVVGTRVVGYLPGYLHEEQYGSGGRLLLLGRLFPHPADTVVGALVVAAVAWWAWQRTDASLERAAVIVVGTAFLVFTPGYGWYAGLLIALVALAGAVEWLPVAVAPSFVYLVHSAAYDPVFYAAAAVAVPLIVRLRRSASARPRAAANSA